MPNSFQGLRGSRLVVDILLPLAAAMLSWPTLARADDALMLRIRQTHAAGINGYELLGAARGNFQVQPSLRDPQVDDLVLVGRDGQGRELFRRAVRNPGNLRAEVFDPVTGQIETAREIPRSGGVVEVHVPSIAGLAAVDLFERSAKAGARSGSATPLKRISRQELDAALLAPMSTLAPPSGSAWLWWSGATSARMDLVLIGDGYTSAEMGKWAADAKKLADGFLADPLFAKNKNRMNILRVDIASIDSGVTEGGVTRRTALGTVVGCYSMPRLVCPDEALTYSAVGAITPVDGRDVIVVVANTQTYGGSGGNIGAQTMHPQAIELGLHEIGHTAFQLADEYDVGTCSTYSEPSEANVTMATTKPTAKWGSLIAGGTTVPTPPGYYPNGTVGLFTGAKYCPTRVYRPTENSRMRSLGQPWHAVNERRADSVFAYYSSGNVTVNGQLSGPGATNYVPTTGSHYSSNGGTFKVSSTGPNNANFNLLLYKWTGSAWVVVAQSVKPGSTESISYGGSSGYYQAAITSVSGSGPYTVTYNFPN
jgi:hypothetical protein